jgi:hypothetical protein
MSDQGAPVVFWTQPLDPMEEDMIEFSGQLLPTTDGTRRRGLVQQINAAAETGHRTRVGDGAWVARHKNLIVSELPTSASGGHPGAPIVIGVFADVRPRRVMVSDLVAGLTAFSHKAGYELDAELARQAMEEVVRSVKARPFRSKGWAKKAPRWFLACVGAMALWGLWAALRWLWAASARLRARIRMLFTR